MVPGAILLTEGISLLITQLNVAKQRSLHGNMLGYEFDPNQMRTSSFC